MVRHHIPKEHKEVALHMTAHGLPHKEIRRLTGISERSIRRLRHAFWQTGDVTRPPLVAGRHRILNAFDAHFLESCIERQPDSSLQELQRLLREVCHVEASLATIWRSLRCQGFSRKKVTRPAIERNERHRLAYRLLIGEQYQPDQLVFVDESHFNRLTLRRSYGWAPIGNRARRRDFFVRGKRYSILPAISLDGILHLDVFDRPVTGDLFSGFISDLLDQMQPFPNRNSVIVMDNASIHKVPGIREAIEEHGMRLLYLPAYSPDLNPIEEAFSFIKTWLRSNRDEALIETEGADADAYTLLWRAVYQVTPDHAIGWYRHSEYLA
ncbi:hypothetical protein EVG20_g6705 [Dentipellis fragilis]|uniref:Tc1-like transposase DDE domain-containing protein n=1 Tax=Dentipellis fragilis TaxID=205917 RepID=A0A4Y9YLS5_9AGAM|nr:hypothetical protein EVG20_g6705 [Dentipellis fragilis]